MSINKSNSFKSFSKGQSKNTIRQTQIKTIFLFLKDNIATNTMVSKETGIPQKNICRFKRDLEKLGLLAEVKKSRCKVTNRLAWFLTTNEKYFPSRTQLSLFFKNH